MSDTTTLTTSAAFRPATDQELLASAAALHELNRWLAVKAYAEKYYGVGNVASATVSSDQESNDEGGSYQSFSGMSCTGHDGQPLEIDWNGPAFQAIRVQELYDAGEGRKAILDKEAADKHAEYSGGYYATDKRYNDEWRRQQILRNVTWRAERLDRDIAFWAEVDAEEDPDEKAAMIERIYEDVMQDEGNSLDMVDDEDHYDFTKRPQLPFELFVRA